MVTYVTILVFFSPACFTYGPKQKWCQYVKKYPHGGIDRMGYSDSRTVRSTVITLCNRTWKNPENGHFFRVDIDSLCMGWQGRFTGVEVVWVWCGQLPTFLPQTFWVGGTLEHIETIHLVCSHSNRCLGRLGSPYSVQGHFQTQKPISDIYDPIRSIRSEQSWPMCFRWSYDPPNTKVWCNLVQNRRKKKGVLMYGVAGSFSNFETVLVQVSHFPRIPIQTFRVEVRLWTSHSDSVFHCMWNCRIGELSVHQKRSIDFSLPAPAKKVSKRAQKIGHICDPPPKG